MFKRRRPSLGTPNCFDTAHASGQSLEDLWEEQWLRKHLRYFLKQILEQVSDKTRQAFELHVVSGWPVEEVSKVLNMSADQIYAAKSRITRRLRKEVQSRLGRKAGSQTVGETGLEGKKAVVSDR
jgi:DNA-directed RNA polymerase specialized sigma24 family protein